VLRVTWGHIIDPAWTVNQIWRTLLGLEVLEGPGAWASALALAVMALLLVLVIERKLRPVEVSSDRSAAAHERGEGARRNGARPPGRASDAAGRSDGRLPAVALAKAGSPSVMFEDVSKFYGEVLGVNRVTLNIPPGITSLVGPNGSGKTTLMNLMTGLIHPDNGRILVRGISPRDPETLMRITGLRDAVRHGAALGDRVHLHHDGAAALRIRAGGGRRKGVEGARARGLTEAANRKVAAYSKGMRQRVRLAQAIAHDPDVLVLDEPLNGLDPLVRAETIDLFRTWAAAGKHVILSSHVLQEVDVISDQVVLIANGTIVAEGQIRGVRDEIDEHPSQFIVRCHGASEVAARLFGEDHITEIKLNDDRMGMLVMTRDRQRFARALGRIATTATGSKRPAGRRERGRLVRVPDWRRVACPPVARAPSTWLGPGPSARLGPGRRGRSRRSSCGERSSRSAGYGSTRWRCCPP
jgi:ABC-2 type transport system ATP-binding protein